MRTILIILGVLILTAVSAEAQPIKTSLYGGGFMGFITGPEMPKDLFKTGFGFSGGFGLQFNPYFELIFKGYYLSFPLDDYEFVKALDEDPDIVINPDLEDIEVTGGGLDAYGILAQLRYYFPTPSEDGPFKPFLTGGLGIIHIGEMDDATLSAPGYDDWKLTNLGESSTDFTIIFGAGADIWVSTRVALYAEAGYQVVFEEDDNTTLIPLLAGIKINVSRMP